MFKVCHIEACVECTGILVERNVARDNVIFVVTFWRETLGVDVLSQSVGTSRNVGDVYPLTVKMATIKVTTVL